MTNEPTLVGAPYAQHAPSSCRKNLLIYHGRSYASIC